MKTQPLHQTELTVGRLSYGAMRISGAWDPRQVTPEMRDRGKAALIAAYESGYTLFDHADIYAQGECERIHGELMREMPSMRDQIVIATKCGIRFGGDPSPDSPHRYDFSKSHILRSCDLSLERLGIETIDIYQLHRPDILMDPDEIADAFDTLHRAGKVRYFGVSNFLPSFVTALQSRLGTRLCVNQVEIHLGRLDCFTDGTLDQFISDRLTPLAWSPLGGGWLGEGGTVPPGSPRNHVLAVADALALKYGVTRTEISLAFLLKHPSGIVPIVGSTKTEKIRQAVKATQIDLDREDWYRLYVAARGGPLP
jgi:predicted oxidoreductase